MSLPTNLAATAIQVPDLDVEQINALADVIRWSGVFASVLIVAGTLLLLRLADGLINSLSETFAQNRMFLHKLRALLHFGVYLTLGLAVVLLSFRLTGPILTLIGGTAAVAMGFALKDLVASLVSGVTIMIDRPFQVGDRVRFNEHYGDITAIGLHSVRLQTLDDNTVTIPNSMFLNQVAACGNYGEVDMMVVVDFHIGADQDVRKARGLVREAAVSSRYVYLPKEVTVLVTQVVIDSYVAVRLRLKAYVLDTRYEKAMETDITLRVLECFAEQGVQAPAVLHRSVADGPRELEVAGRG